jgi:hypothetical protein
MSKCRLCPDEVCAPSTTRCKRHTVGNAVLKTRVNPITKAEGRARYTRGRAIARATLNAELAKNGGTK